MSKLSDVHVVWGGACTSVGGTLAASAAAVRAGVAAFEDHPYIVDSTSKPLVVARAGYVPDDVGGLERLLALAIPAAEEALDVLASVAHVVEPFPVVVGLPPQRPGLPQGNQHQFADRFLSWMSAHHHINRVDTFASGHASGLQALAAGYEMIAAGITRWCLVGGVDSYIDVDTLEWLEACHQVHSAGAKNNAWGFIPGEGAGFCLLASAEAARTLRLDVGVRVQGVAVAHEDKLIKTDSVCLGHGLTEAFERTFASLRDEDEQVDAIVCDMNGEPYRADEFGFATMRTARRFQDSSIFSAPADCWGDVGAASGPLFVNLVAIAHRKRYASPARTLVWTSSESGERAAAILAIDESGSSS